VPQLDAFSDIKRKGRKKPPKDLWGGKKTKKQKQRTTKPLRGEREDIFHHAFFFYSGQTPAGSRSADLLC
jgi:hypothetical protein